MKTPVLESYFNNVAGLQLYQKETSSQVFSGGEYCQVFKNSFYRTPLVAAFENGFFIMNTYELFKFSTLRSISQYGNRWAIHLNYISMTQLAGKEFSTTRNMKFSTS